MKNTNLGELEREVMETVWQKKACTVRDVLTELQKKRRIAYTTVATILQRLCIKGLLAKEKAVSGDVFKPNISRESYTKQVANSFLKNFIGSYGDEAIASFAESVYGLPEKKKKYFLDLLNDAKNK